MTRTAGRRPSLMTLGLAGISIAIVVSVASTVAGQRLNRGQDAAYGRALAARTMVSDLASLGQGMADQESAVRGYALTADPVFLQAYLAGREQTAGAESRLAAEAPRSVAAQQAQLKEAAGAWESWAESRRAAVAATGPSSDAAALATGWSLYDAFRGRLADTRALAVAESDRDAKDAAGWSRAQTRWLDFGALAVQLLLIAMGIVLVQRVLRPIRRLAEVTGELAEGRGGAVPMTGRRDEIGTLASALEGWRAGERERADLSGAMAEVSGLVELKEVVEAATSRLLAIGHADQVVITVIDAQGERRVMASHPSPFSPGAQLPAGSPGARALDLGHPVVDDLRHTPWDPSIEAWRDEFAYGPAMAIPLTSGGRTLGVATLLRSAGRPGFTPHDLERAVLILPYLASAIHVSNLFAAVQASNVELERASRMKSDFLASMSHELRTPLNSIIGFSQLLLDFPAYAHDEERLTRYLGNIQSSGRHLLGLINDVLDLSKIEAGKMTLDIEQADLDSIVLHAITIVDPLAVEKGVRLESPASSGVQLHADALRLKQVLINLLSNAVKFTPEGGRVTLSVSQDAGQVAIAVADTGVGIAPEDQEYIFEEFRQVETSRARAAQGTGLGLALTRRFVRMHGGSITLESELGRGSTFTVRLPTEPRATPVPEPPAGHGRPTVLVIEDDPSSAALITEYLAAGGYHSVVAPTSRAGLRLAAELMPSAITLDVLLPDGDDMSLLRELKADPRTRSIPVVVVSVTEDRKGALALGAVDHIVKPVDSAALLDAVRRHTSGEAGRPILVIDDEREARDLAAEALRAHGYEVIEAGGGRRGIELVRERRPGAVIVDLVMPDVSGFEVVKTLRDDPATSDIPIIVVTAKTLDEAENAYLVATTLGVLSKAQPDGLWSDLVTWLRRVLPRNAGG